MVIRNILCTLSFGFAVILLSCASKPAIVHHGVPFTSSDIKASFALTGPEFRYTVENTGQLYFVTEVPIVLMPDRFSNETDGMMAGVQYSFIEGDYMGPSFPRPNRAIILKPGERFVVRADLRKTYANLKMPHPVPTTKARIRTRAFDSYEAALKYWTARELFRRVVTNETPQILVPYRRG